MALQVFIISVNSYNTYMRLSIKKLKPLLSQVTTSCTETVRLLVLNLISRVINENMDQKKILRLSLLNVLKKLFRHPWEMLLDGDFSKIDIIIGTNQDEGKL